MKSLIRLFLPVGTFGVLLCTVVVLNPPWASALVPDWGQLPELLSSIDQNQRRAEAMTEADATILQRIARKDAVVADLLAGQLTLLEAAAHFRRLNDDPSVDYACLFRAAYGDGSEEELCCRNVIAYAAGTGNLDRVQANALQARLEAELRAHLERHGTLRLPEVEAGRAGAGITGRGKNP